MPLKSETVDMLGYYDDSWWVEKDRTQVRTFATALGDLLDRATVPFERWPVRNREQRTPLAPFNGTSPEMAAVGSFFRDQGLYTFVRWNYFFTNPPLSITEAELREGFAIIDMALHQTDQAVQ